ncbi:McrB family protein [Sutcliffiella sp. NPDC057660]|uniref:McrB family protein n=1 Tax=Sutcliffiella sp. NPDC057660 TaxID=3346199 RepID=UPI0036A347BA
MIQADNLTSIIDIEDTTERNQQILDMVHPTVRRLIDSFVDKYGERDPYLRQLKIHTYEQTLRTTIADSKNPKYAEKKQHYGNKAFVELIDDSNEDSAIVVLRLEFHLKSREVRMAMSTDFYPIWVYHYTKALHQEMDNAVQELDSEIQVYTFEEKKTYIEKRDFMQTVGQYIKNKRKPTIYFGTFSPLEGIIQEEDLIDRLWTTYLHLSPLRTMLEREAEVHSRAIHFMRRMQEDTTSITIELFSKTYQVEIDKEVKKVKTNDYKQLFYIYDQDQLITEGHISYFTRDPHESIGIYVNNYGHIFHRMRKLATANGEFEWYIKKAFYQRGRYNENNENQVYQEKTVELFKEHNLLLNDANAFYVGTYLGERQTFTEPMAKLKERLITAASLIADVKEFFTFPKGNMVEEPVTEEEEDDFEQDMESYESSFDFQQIMDLVEQSGFTFSIDIIRDFYLNLTSLDDKHFVILNGISGTGKTQLCKVFANAVYGLDYREDNPYMKIVPVRPDWMDSTSLFGYYSSFEKRYMKTEFLDMLLQANKEKDKPHFVVLDEMNLARVEYYLSDYLSAVESRKPIQLHNLDDLTEIPKTIEIPHNFYVVGTINVDETTHSISDKVLDRAFVMTLSDVNFISYWEDLDDKLKNSVQKEWQLLLQVHQQLSEYDLHFGYRTMTEMIRKLYKNSLLPEDFRMESSVAVDRVLSEKVIPKVRGDERIAPLLDNLQNLFLNQFGTDAESYKHIERMRKELERYGATQFWR